MAKKAVKDVVSKLFENRKGEITTSKQLHDAVAAVYRGNKPNQNDKDLKEKTMSKLSQRYSRTRNSMPRAATTLRSKA